MERSSNRTFLALLSRGINTTLAQQIAKGHTLASLKKNTEIELKSLGLTEQNINSLLKASRPPIPPENIMKLLHANRFCCCVCRNHELAVIIHHIEPWAKSKNHDVENLTVLCLHHHGEAHTQRQLSQNLDKKALKGHKSAWEREVELQDTKTILRISQLEYARWDYINHQRLFEIAMVKKVNFKTLKYYKHALLLGLINHSGLLLSPIHWGQDPSKMFQLYSGEDCILLYAYMKEVVEATLANLPIKDASNFLSKSELNNLIAVNDLISVQGAHTFKTLIKSHTYTGKNQSARVSRSLNGIKITFVIDRWEATSTSSKVDRLAGRKVCTSIAHVKDISEENGILVLNCSGLLIGSFFNTLKTREYGGNTVPVKNSDSELEEEYDAFLERIDIDDIF